MEALSSFFCLLSRYMARLYPGLLAVFCNLAINFIQKIIHSEKIHTSGDKMKTRDSTMYSKMSGLGEKTAVCLLSFLSSRHESCCWDASATCATFLRAVKDIDKAGCLLDPGYQPWVYAHYLCCDRAPRRTWLRTPAFILNQKFEASDSACDPSLVGTAC